jgi:hypothetical protein
MNEEGNNAKWTRNYGCRRKELNSIYPDSVFGALVI